MAFTRLLQYRKLNSNFLHRRRKVWFEMVIGWDLSRLITRIRILEKKSCGKQECSLHEICYMFLLRNWFVTQNNPIVQFNPVSSSATSIYNVSSLREHPTFPDVTTSYPAKWSPISVLIGHARWKFTSANRRHFPDRDSEPTSSSGASFFRVVEASAKREWHGDEPQETMGRVAGCLLPAFLCVHIFIERKTSRYEAGSDTSSVWNLCSRFSDVISRETSGGVAKCRLFSQALV